MTTKRVSCRRTRNRSLRNSTIPGTSVYSPLSLIHAADLYLVCPLPSLTDPELLQIFSEGIRIRANDDGNFLTFNQFCWIGDSFLQHHLRLRLFRLFGLDNHQICHNIYPHAKSNIFLRRIGQYYCLDRHVRNFDYARDKHWADLVEAWIGMIEIERDMWFGERHGRLEDWIEWLCGRRYGDMIREWVELGVYQWGKTGKVRWTETKAMFPTEGRLAAPGTGSTGVMGYWVEARPLEESSKDLVGRAFSRNKTIAEERAREKLHARTAFSRCLSKSSARPTNVTNPNLNTYLRVPRPQDPCAATSSVARR